MKQKKERLNTKHLMLKAYDDADRQQMVNILLNEEIKKKEVILCI